MTFTAALTELFDNSARITRRVWNSPSIYCALVEGQLCIRGFASSGVDDGLPHPWTVTESDYYADDWEIVDA